MLLYCSCIFLHAADNISGTETYNIKHKVLTNSSLHWLTVITLHWRFYNNVTFIWSQPILSNSPCRQKLTHKIKKKGKIRKTTLLMLKGYHTWAHLIYLIWIKKNNRSSFDTFPRFHPHYPEILQHENWSSLWEKEDSLYMLRYLKKTSNSTAMFCKTPTSPLTLQLKSGGDNHKVNILHQEQTSQTLLKLSNITHSLPFCKQWCS